MELFTELFIRIRLSMFMEVDYTILYYTILVFLTLNDIYFDYSQDELIGVVPKVASG